MSETHQRTLGEWVVQNAAEGDTVCVAGRHRGGRHHPDLDAEYEVRERVNQYTLKVKRVGGGYARMEGTVTGPGVRVFTGGGDPGTTWDEAHIE